MNQFAMVFCACSNESEARSIASALVELQLAACVQILPAMTSIYRWQGKVETSSESLLLIKTIHERFDEVASKIRELHSYDVPEIVAIPISKGSEPYLKWLETSVAGK